MVCRPQGAASPSTRSCSDCVWKSFTEKACSIRKVHSRIIRFQVFPCHFPKRSTRYGTQAEIVDGAVRLSPIEDEAHVDEGRAELGMMSLRAQLEKICAVDP